LPGRFLILLYLIAVSPFVCAAQSQDPDSGATSTANPATPPANPQQDATAEKKKPKKVWTNDEIGSVRGTVSVVGNPTTSAGGQKNKKSAASSASNSVRQHQIAAYRNQILKLQAQIDGIDKQITQLKDFKADNASPSGGIDPHHGYTMLPLEEQVKQLQEKKKQLETKISDVQDEARKAGIEAGELL
jgi:uncharacterized protein (UPF0335 family)